MEQRQIIAKRYWIVPAVCCFLLTGFMVMTLVVWPQRLSAILSTGGFAILFVASGILYLLRWRPMIKVMQIIICVFYLLVGLYWWQTGQFIGVLPCALVTLLVWQNGRLEKIYKTPGPGVAEPDVKQQSQL
jgi:hypothetical protein